MVSLCRIAQGVASYLMILSILYIRLNVGLLELPRL